MWVAFFSTFTNLMLILSSTVHHPYFWQTQQWTNTKFTVSAIQTESQWLFYIKLLSHLATWSNMHQLINVAIHFTKISVLLFVRGGYFIQSTLLYENVVIGVWFNSIVLCCCYMYLDLQHDHTCMWHTRCCAAAPMKDYGCDTKIELISKVWMKESVTFYPV